MKKLAFAMIGCAAFAAGAQQETGRVISSTPVIQQVAVPRQVCGVQPVAQPGPSGGGAVIGAIVGGLLGNTIGHGSGRAAATGIGAVAGAAVGNSVEGQGQPQYAQQCHTQTYYENRTMGYDVTYEYAGRQYRAQLPYDPGPTIRLQITPVGAGDAAPPAAGYPGSPPPLVTAPPLSQAPAQAVIYAAAPVVVPPPVAYPAYGWGYARPAYPYPPVSLHLSYVHRHRHWR
jgi:uncharacterized protein YcfJ